MTEAELDELEEFLISDATPENCLDISGLDVFLHAILIGPTTLMPSRWMPKIWNETDGYEMVWDSMEQANRITGISSWSLIRSSRRSSTKSGSR